MPASVEELYAKHAKRVKGIVYGYWSYKQFVPVADLCQEIWSTVVASIDGFDGGNEWGWLFTLSRNVMRQRGQHLTRQRRDNRLLVHELPDELSYDADTVIDWMDSFTDQERKVVELLLAGHEMKEIAKIMGTSKRTVERLRYQCRLKVRIEVST